MSRRLANLTLDTLADLLHPCRDCVFWELDQRSGPDACAPADPGLDKEAWISQALLEWGSCGMLAYVDDTPAGYVIYAPPGYLPRAASFPTAPASPDAALLTTIHIAAGYAGSGLGRALVQAAAQDLARRGIPAVEAFGDARGGTTSGPDTGGRPDTGGGCVTPAGFFVAVGFKTVRPHPRYPRLRLELPTAATWQAELEQALARLFETADQTTVDPSAASVARSARTSMEPVGTSDSTG
jgi:GNAT superfamily N-acetyltransferase